MGGENNRRDSQHDEIYISIHGTNIISKDGGKPHIYCDVSADTDGPPSLQYVDHYSSSHLSRMYASVKHLYYYILLLVLIYTTIL